MSSRPECEGSTAPAPTTSGAGGGAASGYPGGRAQNSDDPAHLQISLVEMTPRIAPFRWWCEDGLAANVKKVAQEFCRWRRLAPVHICLTGPPGCGARELGSKLALRHNLYHVNLDDVIEKTQALETPLGLELRQKVEELNVAFNNPKSQGPFLLPASLTAQVVEAALSARPVAYRGFVLSGFPQTVEEATAFFLEDGPPPTPDPEAEDAEGRSSPAPAAPATKLGKAEEAAAAAAAEAERAARRVPRRQFSLDAVALLSSAEEQCLARMQDVRAVTEVEFKKKIERYKLENPPPPGSVPEPPGDPKKGAAKAAEPPPVEGPQGLTRFFLGGEERFSLFPPERGAVEFDADAVLGSKDASTAAVAQLWHTVEEARGSPVLNFTPPAPDTNSAPVEEAPNPQEGINAKEEEERKQREMEAFRRKKEADDRLEQVKREEFSRLEKHSEPLRQYLSSLVVPTLTSGLIEVCRSQPEDPVGYLAEYLAVYSKVTKERQAAARQVSLAAAAAPAAPAAGGPPEPTSAAPPQ